jgi:hypothetical protein
MPTQTRVPQYLFFARGISDTYLAAVPPDLEANSPTGWSAPIPAETRVCRRRMALLIGRSLLEVK